MICQKKVGNIIVRGLNCKKKYLYFAFSSPLNFNFRVHLEVNFINIENKQS